MNERERTLMEYGVGTMREFLQAEGICPRCEIEDLDETYCPRCGELAEDDR